MDRFPLDVYHFHPVTLFPQLLISSAQISCPLLKVLGVQESCLIPTSALELQSCSAPAVHKFTARTHEMTRSWLPVNSPMELRIDLQDKPSSFNFQLSYLYIPRYFSASDFAFQCTSPKSPRLRSPVSLFDFYYSSFLCIVPVQI